MLRKTSSAYFIAIVTVFLYVGIGYNVQRYETATLLSLYVTLFALYLLIIFSKQASNTDFWIGCAIAFRFSLLFSTPNLSEDFYRFIWDGRLLASGYHPFAHPPSFYIENNIPAIGIDESLYSKLNSKDYFTIYPPVAQFFFWVSAKLSSSVYGSLVVLKTFNFISEIASILLIKKLLQELNLSSHRVLIYALNPLIVIELTGNAHFEAVMIFFIVLSLYFMLKKQSTFSSITMALSIGVKLIPLIFLPAIKRIEGWKNARIYFAVVCVTLILLFLPLLNASLLTGLGNSIPYFLSKFEFNASIYYLIRAIGYAVSGFNIIAIAGPLLSVVAFFLILRISMKGLPKFLSQQPIAVASGRIIHVLEYIHIVATCLLIYYLFTTILHPWYISTLLALSVFTNFRFMIVWSFMIFFTYAGYTQEGFSEDLWLVTLEYLSVLGFLGYELWRRVSRKSIAPGHLH